MWVTPVSAAAHSSVRRVVLTDTISDALQLSASVVGGDVVSL